MAADKSLNVTVPEDQCDRYDEEADRMGFDSRAAYLRAMINAGRREFDLEPQVDDDEEATLRGFIDERVLNAIAATDGAGSGEVVDEIVGEIEGLVTESIERLNEEGAINYSVDADGLVVAGKDN